MIQESNTAIGCALAKYEEEPWDHVYLFTCNYASNNRYGCPIFNEGIEAMGEGCVNGLDGELAALCNITEPIKPNLSTCAVM